MAEKINGFLVPISLSSLRFRMPNGEIEMGVNIPADQLRLDVPGATHKLYSRTLDPTQWYQVETIVTLEGGIRSTRSKPPFTGQIDDSPNIPRNPTSGEFDEVNVYLVARPAPTPATPFIPA